MNKWGSQWPGYVKNYKVLKQLANIVSTIFHPLLMTTLLVGVLYLFVPTAVLPVRHDSVHLILLMILILTFILPMLSVGMLRLTKTVSSMQLENRKERLVPFIFITLYYGLTTYFFANKLIMGNTLIVLFGTITLTILLVTVITFFYKISAHTAGTAGVVGIMVALHAKYLDSLLFWPIVVAIILHGIVSSARLYLQTHSPAEVHAGAILGFVVNYCIIFFLV